MASAPGDVLLIPNVGAEEGDWRAFEGAPVVRNVARLWGLLFAGAELPADLAAAPVPAVYPWLATPGDCAAWLNTQDAAAEAARAGRPLAGAAPGVVERVHDKAFAHAAATAEGLVPVALANCISVFDSAELRDSEAALARVRAAGGRWPAWTGGRFALKPRRGGSGRGRVGGTFGRDESQLPGALPRLARRGGALLEPWLERLGDFSTQLWIGPEGELVLLGTCEQVVSPSGQPLGQRGSVDSRGRVRTGRRFDADLREAAVAIAQRAAAEGYHGPCGVDAFEFRGPEGPLLRPVVEFNARFTTGTIALGLVRRALRLLERRMGLTADHPLVFYFGLDAPASGWPRSGSDGELLLLPLGANAGGARPGLLFAREPEALDRALAPS